MLCVCAQGSKVVLHSGDAQEPDVANDIMLLPDTETLADRPKPCLAEVASLPRDWARLFDGQLFTIGKGTHDRIQVAHTQLSCGCLVAQCTHSHRVQQSTRGSAPAPNR